MSRRLRRDCEARLADLGLPPDAAAMTDVAIHLARRRRRPIHLLPLALQAGVTGAWLPTSTTDYVVYELSTSPRHQAQIVGHELAHIICGHAAAPHGAMARLPLLALGAAEVMLARETYTSREEQLAEQMADALLLRLERAPGAAEGNALVDALQQRSHL